MKTKVGERGQITIPKKLRDRLGIRPGMRLEVTERNGKLVATRTGYAESLASVTGILPPFDVDAYLSETRGRPWDPALDPRSRLGVAAGGRLQQEVAVPPRRRARPRQKAETR